MITLFVIEPTKKNAHLILSFEYKPVAFGLAFGQRVKM